jgi:hypothetical protein
LVWRGGRCRCAARARRSGGGSRGAEGCGRLPARQRSAVQPGRSAAKEGEFARVAANLDEFCQHKDFKKALVSIEWMETCLKNWRKPYKLGYCSRGKKYFCAVFPDSEGCKGAD